MITIKDKTVPSTIYVPNTGTIDHLTKGEFEVEFGNALDKLNEFDSKIEPLITREQADEALQPIKDKLNEISYNK